jgi:hypothetical protein
MSDEAKTGDGLSGPGAGWVVRVKDELRLIQGDGAQYIGSRRSESDDVRMCRWDGQSKDGRKHRADKDGVEPFPFEGACDVRLRTADTVVNERVDLLVEASLRAGVAPAFKGTEATDQGRALRMATVHGWVLKQMRDHYRPTLERCAQYQEGDSPAVGILGVFWEREVWLEGRRVTAGELGQMVADVLKGQGRPGADVEGIAASLVDETRRETTEALLVGLFPVLKAARVKRMCGELVEKGECRFPREYLAVNRPVIRAYRLWEDIFFRGNLADGMERAEMVVCREILTKAELQGKARAEEWSEEFVKGMLGDDENGKGQEEQTAFPESAPADSASEWAMATTDRMKGKYEVLRCYVRTANEDGVPGLYFLTMSGGLDVAAKDMELLEYQHGRQPFVVFPREYLRSNVLDSRGVPEIAGTHQSLQKLSMDCYGDHVQMSTMPPVKKSARRAGMSTTLRPGGEITVMKSDDVAWMEKSAYPRENEVFRKDLQRGVDDYFGRLHGESDTQMVILRRQALVNRWLDRLVLVHVQLVQLWQQYLTDEELGRIVGPGGLQVARSTKEIQGQFDLELSFDVRDMDPEYVVKKMEVIGKYVLPLDTDASLDRTALKRWALTSISPQLATVVLPEEAARSKEISDEEMNWVKAMAGIEPEMKENGQAFGLRMQVWQELMGKNATDLQQKEERVRGIVESRLQHLAFMQTQQENALIGRLGARPEGSGGRV